MKLLNDILKSHGHVLFYALLFASSCRSQRNYPADETQCYSDNSYIRHKNYEETLKIAKILLTDKEDLIHKAVGWMLRKMMRYAIEKFSEPEKQKYLKGKI
ncbi:MAG: DNA alkylation repair protein [Deltaproteobacteria bacterium]|nr:DNA alkylation repair protein [Deltaproteobacteria bacterium]